MPGPSLGQGYTSSPIPRSLSQKRLIKIREDQVDEVVITPWNDDLSQCLPDKGVLYHTDLGMYFKRFNTRYDIPLWTEKDCSSLN